MGKCAMVLLSSYIVCASGRLGGLETGNLDALAVSLNQHPPFASIAILAHAFIGIGITLASADVTLIFCMGSISHIIAAAVQAVTVLMIYL